MRSVHRTLLALALTSQGLWAAYAQSPPVRDGVALSDPQVAAELPRYLTVPSVRFADWLADGSMLISTHVGQLSQIGHLTAGGQLRAAATRDPLASAPAAAPPTHSVEPVSFAAAGAVAAAARPYTSDAFAFVTPGPDSGGQANAQLYLQTLGATARLLAATRADAGAPAWAHDGKRIAYMGAGDSGVYVLDTATPGAQPELVTATSGARWHVLGWSIDDGTLLLGRRWLKSAAPATVRVEGDGVSADEAAESTGPEAGGDAGADAASRADPVAATDASATPRPVDPELALYLADVHGGTVAAVAAPGARGRTGQTARPALGFGSDQRVADQRPPALALTARFASDGRAILLLTRQSCGRGRDPGVADEFLHLCQVDPTADEWRSLSAPALHDVELFDESADGSWLAYTLNDAGASRLMLIDQHLKLDSAVTALPPGVISTLRFDPVGKRLAVTFESARAPADVYVLDLGTRVLARWTDSDANRLDAAAFVLPQLVQFPTWDQVDGQPRQLSAWLYSPTTAAAGTATPRPVLIWLCGGGGQQCRPGYAPFVQYLVQRQGFAVLAPNVRGASGFGPGFEAAGAGALRDDAVRDIGSLLVWVGLQPGLDPSRVAVLGEGYGSYLALASLAAFGDRLQGAVAAFPRRHWPLQNALAIRRPVLLVQGLADPNVPSYQVAQLREGLRARGVAVQYLAAGDEAGQFMRRSDRAAYHVAAATFLARLVH